MEADEYLWSCVWSLLCIFLLNKLKYANQARQGYQHSMFVCTLPDLQGEQNPCSQGAELGLAGLQSLKVLLTSSHSIWIWGGLSWLGGYGQNCSHLHSCLQYPLLLWFKCSETRVLKLRKLLGPWTSTVKSDRKAFQAPSLCLPWFLSLLL